MMVESRVLAARIFADDLKATLTDEWSATYGRMPRIDLTVERRIRGLGKNVNENIIIYPQSESTEFFGLGGDSAIQTVRAEITLNTNKSADRFEQINAGIFSIIFSNVAPRGKTVEYLRWLNNGFTNLSHRGRNYFSGVYDIVGEAYNPKKDF